MSISQRPQETYMSSNTVGFHDFLQWRKSCTMCNLKLCQLDGIRKDMSGQLKINIIKDLKLYSVGQFKSFCGEWFWTICKEICSGLSTFRKQGNSTI